MRAREFTANSETKEQFMDMFSKFLPLAMHYIDLKSLPKMVFMTDVDSPDQPTFGMYVNNENILYVALANRHPVDILRTVAHELVHYKQDTEHQLNIDSGKTGSPEENQAHQVAGIVMRHFNKRYPEFLKSKPIIA
jgi:Zn-dependent peptidase ImmA (M78 family)